MSHIHEVKEELLWGKLEKIKREISLTGEREGAYFSSTIRRVEQLFEELKKKGKAYQSLNSSIPLEYRQNIYEKYLYTLRDIESIIERYFEAEWYLYEVYKYQHNNPKLTGSLKALRKVCDQVTQEVSIENDMMLILGSNYSISDGLGFQSKGPGRFLFMPYFEKEVPLMWGLVTHEIGHAFMDQTQFAFNSFNRVMKERIKQDFPNGKTKKARKEEQIIIFERTWNYWKEEIFSDIFATKTLGFGYTAPFIHQNVVENPYRLVYNEEDIPEHPPVFIRVKIQLEILKKLVKTSESREFTEILSDIFSTYLNSVKEQKEENYSFLIEEELIKGCINDCIGLKSAFTKREKNILQLLADIEKGNGLESSDLLKVLNVIWLLKLRNPEMYKEQEDKLVEAILKR